MATSMLDPDLVFDALGDPTRRRILRVLGGGPSPVVELTARVPVGRPAVSKHLRVLQGAGLVTYETAGTRHLYALAPDGYAVAQAWFAQTWKTVLDAFAAHVEKSER